MRTPLMNVAFAFLIFSFGIDVAFGQSHGEVEWVYPRPQGNTLNDVWVFNKDKVLAVGDFGTVIISEDSGENWSIQTYAGGTNHNIQHVFFSSESTGWCIAGYPIPGYEEKSTLLKSVNGGVSWLQVPIDDSEGLNSIFFINDNVGWVAGNKSSLFKTEDGGVSWVKQNVGPENFWEIHWHQIYFLDEDTGFLIGNGNRSEIHKTTDGGENWLKVEEVRYSKTYYSSIFFSDDETGWLRKGSTLYRTTDKGETWMSVGTASGNIYFIDTDRGFDLSRQFYFGSHMLVTSDGGETWATLDIEYSNNSWYAIDFADSLVGWGVGRDGLLFKTEDAGYTWARDITNNPPESVFSPPYIFDANLWWQTSYSVIFKTEDGGRSWNQSLSHPSLMDNHPSGLFFIDNKNGWFAGHTVYWGGEIGIGGGLIFRTTDGGQTWQLTWEGFTEDIKVIPQRVHFANANFGLACGRNKLLRTDDGGLNWQLLDNPLPGDIVNVHCVSENVCYVWNFEDMAKTNNTGTSWNLLPNSGISYGTVKFVNDSVRWVAQPGTDAAILKTIDNGLSWKTQIEHVDGYNAFFLNENEAWVGQGSTILKTDDGGEYWRYWHSGSQRIDWIKAVEGDDGLTLFFGPHYGMLRTTDSMVTSINVAMKEQVIDNIHLHQNYPNPFNATTDISFALQEKSQIKLEIFNILGQRIDILLEGQLEAGNHKIHWNPGELTSGLYIYSIRVRDSVHIKKMLLLR